MCVYVESLVAPTLLKVFYLWDCSPFCEWMSNKRWGVCKYFYIWVILQKHQIFLVLQESRSLDVTRREGREDALILISFSLWASGCSLVKLRLPSDCGQAVLWNFMWPVLGADCSALASGTAGTKAEVCL